MKHGTVANYQRGKCRCSECTAAANAYVRAWRAANPGAEARRKAKQSHDRSVARSARAQTDVWVRARHDGAHFAAKPVMSFDTTHAACRNYETDLWFTEAGVFAALGVCGGCPVRRQCLDYALAANEPAGVWGGMTEEGRRNERRRRQRIARKDRAVAS